jgi:hypothetical protein
MVLLDWMLPDVDGLQFAASFAVSAVAFRS